MRSVRRRAAKRRPVRRTRKYGGRVRKSSRKSYGRRRSTRRSSTRRRSTKTLGLKSDPGSGAQFTKKGIRVRVGTRKNYLSKLVRSNEQKSVFRFSAVNPYMNTSIASRNFSPKLNGGAYALMNYADIGNDYYLAPLHLYDITSCNNYTNDGFQVYNPSWEWLSQRVSGRVVFQQMLCDAASGVSTTGQWRPENIANNITGSVATTPFRRTMLDSVDVKMLCYGAVQVATTFTIDFIQLKQDYLHPDFLFSNTLTNDVGGDPDWLAQSINFWNFWAKSCTSNPISSEYNAYRSMYKIIKTHKFTLQPKLLNESNTSNNGHAHEVDISVPIYRTMKYDWNNSIIDPAINEPSSYQLNSSPTMCTVKPRDRIYMMIRATNPTTVIAPGLLNSNIPSYDLILRKHTTHLG